MLTFLQEAGYYQVRKFILEGEKTSAPFCIDDVAKTIFGRHSVITRYLIQFNLHDGTPVRLVGSNRLTLVMAANELFARRLTAAGNN